MGKFVVVAWIRFLLVCTVLFVLATRVNVAALGTYGLPSWWNGTCNDVNYFNAIHVHPFLLTSWRGIQACGPLPFTVKTSDHLVTFPGGCTEQEFECVELVKRYIYLAYGINAICPANGNQIVDKYTAAYPQTFHKYLNNGSAHLYPIEGDVLSYGGNTAAGHTSIVTSSAVDSSGNGTINVIEQNNSASGTAQHTIRNWVIQKDPYHLDPVISWMTARSTSTTVNFALSLTAIGTNTSVGENNNPRNPLKSAVVQLRDANNNTIQTKSTTVSYSKTTGLFSGSVSFSSLQGGPYNIAVKLSNTLNKLASNWFQPGGTINEPTLLPLSGDVDGNNVINILDYNDLIACYGSRFASCPFKQTSDLNDDGQVDGIDLNILYRAMSGTR